MSSTNAKVYTVTALASSDRIVLYRQCFTEEEVANAVLEALRLRASYVTIKKHTTGEKR